MTIMTNVEQAIYQMLNVEEEIFTIAEATDEIKYKFQKRILYVNDDDYMDWQQGYKPVDPQFIQFLLERYHTIKKALFLPTKGETYFSYDDKWQVQAYVWEDLPVDWLSYQTEIIFRTREKAEQEKESIKKHLTTPKERR